MLCFLTTFLFVLDCGKGKHVPSPQEKFVQVYVELVKLRERLPSTNPVFVDSSRTILKKYGLTKQEYDQNLAYFNEEPERWEAFYQEVLKRLEHKENVPSSTDSLPKHR